MSQTVTHLPTQRLQLQPAPGGLALVQDLLNTRDIGQKVPDLLATVDGARGWLLEVLDQATGDGDWLRDLADGDLAGLRTLRADIESLLSGDPVSAQVRVARTALVLGTDGELRLAATGQGWQRFAAAVWAEVFLAQQTGTWKRLKLCHYQPCASAFYDRSKNNSGVWHDVRMCGNVVNLRASRARRRASVESPG